MGFGRFGRYCMSEIPKGCNDFDSFQKEYGIMFDIQNFVNEIKETMIRKSESILIPDNVKQYIINHKLDHALECWKFSWEHTFPDTKLDLSNCDIGLLNVIKYHQVVNNGSLLSEYEGRDFYPEISKHMMNIDGYDSFRLWVALTVCQEVNEYLKCHKEICKPQRYC
jgi:hypothetical protein